MYNNLLFFTTYVYDILCFCQLMYTIYSIFVTTCAYNKLCFCGNFIFQ